MEINESAVFNSFFSLVNLCNKCDKWEHEGIEMNFKVLFVFLNLFLN